MKPSEAAPKSLLEKLTIVIPSINHGFLLERSIEYWRQIPVKVHIVDGSKNPQFVSSDFKAIENISYHHEHFSNEKWSNFFSIMNFASTLPTTKYSAICGDDDFFTYSGLISCIENLEERDSVDAVLGRVAYFRESNDPQKWSMKGLNHRSTSLQSSSNLLDRKAGKAPWLMYGIVKTELWSRLLQISYADRLPHIELHELLVRELSWMMCRSKITDQILSIRQNTIAGSNVGESIRLTDWLSDTKNAEIKNEVARKLYLGLTSVNPSYSESSAREICNEVFLKYVKVDKVKLVSKKSLKQTLIKFVPRVFKVGAMFFINSKVALQGTTFRIHLFFLFLRKSRIKFSQGELSLVSKILRADHDNFIIRAISR